MTSIFKKDGEYQVLRDGKLMVTVKNKQEAKNWAAHFHTVG